MKYLLLVLFLLTSCSKSWYCRHCLDGATTKTDTIVQIIKVPVPADSVDSLLSFDQGRKVTKEDSLEWMNWEAVVPVKPILIKDSTGRASASLQFKKNGKAELKAKCEPDSIPYPVPTYITNTTTVEKTLSLKDWLLIAAGLIVAFGVGRITR